jgi:hypothetical protein
VLFLGLLGDIFIGLALVVFRGIDSDFSFFDVFYLVDKLLCDMKFFVFVNRLVLKNFKNIS